MQVLQSNNLTTEAASFRNKNSPASRLSLKMCRPAILRKKKKRKGPPFLFFIKGRTLNMYLFDLALLSERNNFFNCSFYNLRAILSIFLRTFCFVLIDARLRRHQQAELTLPISATSLIKMELTSGRNSP